jgi:hypothetical protein
MTAQRIVAVPALPADSQCETAVAARGALHPWRNISFRAVDCPSLRWRDDDARWLFDAFTAAPVKRDVKIGRGTHLMHLESMRLALWRESIDFITGDDVAPVP